MGNSFLNTNIEQTKKLYFNAAGVTKKNELGKDIQSILQKEGRKYCRENYIDFYGGYTAKEIKEFGTDTSEFEDLYLNGKEISFIMEPDNKYDKNAIKIYVQYSTDRDPIHVGYVPKEKNVRLKTILENHSITSVSAFYVGGKIKKIDYCLDTDKESIKNVELTLGLSIEISYIPSSSNNPNDGKINYTNDEINSLNKTENFEGVNIVLPEKEAYKKLSTVSSEIYSIENGNPLSDFFISSVVAQGSTTFGYLVGQYVNQGEDIKLYTVKSNEIAKFLDENPVVKETGFINARLSSRANRTSNEPTYFLKSSLYNLSFKDVPNLMSTFEEAGKFF